MTPDVLMSVPGASLKMRALLMALQVVLQPRVIVLEKIAQIVYHTFLRIQWMLMKNCTNVDPEHNALMVHASAYTAWWKIGNTLRMVAQ